METAKGKTEDFVVTVLQQLSKFSLHLPELTIRRALNAYGVTATGSLLCDNTDSKNTVI